MEQHPLHASDQESSDFKAWFYGAIAVCALLVIGFIWLLVTHPFWAIGIVLVLGAIGYWLYRELGRMIDGNSESPEHPKEATDEKVF